MIKAFNHSQDSLQHESFTIEKGEITQTETTTKLFRSAQVQSNSKSYFTDFILMQ